jgi:hypothetical protein
MELFLDTRRAGSGLGRALLEKGVWRLIFIPPSKSNSTPRLAGYFNQITKNVKNEAIVSFVTASDKTVPAYARDIKFAYKPEKDGYTAEYAFPLRNFLFGKPKNGKVFGFDIILNDQDHKNEPAQTSMRWYGKERARHNPSIFGKVELTGKKQ